MTDLLVGSALYLITSAALLSGLAAMNTLHHRQTAYNAERDDLQTVSSWVDELLSYDAALTIPDLLSVGNAADSLRKLTLSDRLKPMADSAAITALSINTKVQYTVRDAPDGALFYGCPRYSTAYRTDTLVELFLGGTSDGYLLLKGQSRAVTGSNSCREFTLELTDSITNFVNTAALETVRLIIPVEQVATLYLASDGSFRYLSTSGLEVKENQPIVSESFKSFETKETGNKLTVTIKGKHTYHLTKHTLLSKALGYNLLFH